MCICAIPSMPAACCFVVAHIPTTASISLLCLSGPLFWLPGHAITAKALLDLTDLCCADHPGHLRFCALHACFAALFCTWRGFGQQMIARILFCVAGLQLHPVVCKMFLFVTNRSACIVCAFCNRPTAFAADGMRLPCVCAATAVAIGQTAELLTGPLSACCNACQCETHTLWPAKASL